MSLPHAVLLGLALYMVQLFLQETTRYGFSLRQIVGNRDRPPPMTVLAARLDRAKNNMLEAMPFFLGLAMLDLSLPAVPQIAQTGAEVFLVARLFYIPAYLSGLPWLRSLIWLAANAGLVLMALPLI